MRAYSLLMMVLPMLFSSALDAQPIRQAQLSSEDSRSRSGLLQRMFGAPDSKQLLSPDEAFKIATSATDPQTIVVQFTPAKGYYFYRDKFVLGVQEPIEVKIASVDWPRGEIKSDPFFGETEVFDRPAEAIVRLNRTIAQALAITLRVEYQGCNYVVEVCYPPAEKRFRVDLPAARTLQ